MEKAQITRVYYLCVAVGLGFALYLYGVKFDDLSETELVNTSILWVLPLAFGIYGLAAEAIIGRIASGKAETASQAIQTFVRATALAGLVLALPLLWLDKDSQSVRAAAAGALLWGAVLFSILVVLWPLL